MVLASVAPLASAVDPDTTAIAPDHARQRAAGSVDAVEHARGSIGATLKAAYKHAGLTQEGLAKALKKSQALVSVAELGTTGVGEAYSQVLAEANVNAQQGQGRCPVTRPKPHTAATC